MAYIKLVIEGQYIRIICWI